MQFKAICLIICSFFSAVQTVHALEVCGDLKQGELLLIKDDKVKKLSFSNNLGTKEYPLTKDEGIALVALHRDAPKKVLFDTFDNTDNIKHYELDVTPTKWDIQRINGVAQSKVTPDKSADAEIKREQEDVGRAVNHVSTYEGWKNGFIVPVEGAISGYFGNQRIFNGTPKSPHSGTDIAAPEGTPVKASGDGKVILSGKNYFYTGNMVIIDHGQGLQTIYAHLKEAKVKEGDFVSKGDIIGTVGKTGRATGPHLHWGASLNNVRFRPHSLLNIMKKTCHEIKSNR